MKKKIIFIAGLLLSVMVSNEILAQESTGKYGSDSITCIQNNSLYFEFYKQWKKSDYKNESWNDALPSWRWVFINCPKSTINIYLHGEKMVKHLIKISSDKALKESYIDTLMMVYDQRIQYFGKEGYVLGKKGVDLYKLRPSAFEQSYGILQKSIEMQENKSRGPNLIYYFRSAEKMVKAEKAEKSILLDIYDQSSDIIDYNIKNAKNEKTLKSWENVKGNLELSIEPYANCEDLINIYTPKFESTPNDVELLKKITKKLDKRNCTKSDLFFQATENLHKLQPTANSAELMGKMYIKKESYTKAAEYLKESIALCEDDNNKADTYYLLANVYFQIKQYSTARSNCYSAIKLRANDGKPYILIGDMYVATAKSCGDNDLTKTVAYWVAVDKYKKAKSVDSSVAEAANTKIKTYSQYFPATETIFFYDLKKGDSYKVECWINETTTVRTSD